MAILMLSSRVQVLRQRMLIHAQVLGLSRFISTPIVVVVILSAELWHIILVIIAMLSSLLIILVEIVKQVCFIMVSLIHIVIVTKFFVIIVHVVGIVMIKDLVLRMEF